jgi:hypothetical protein
MNRAIALIGLRSWLFAQVFVLAATPVFAQEPAAVGRIKLASGSVFLIRTSGSVPAGVGHDVFEGDGLRTGPDGRVGITLKDDTRISLGPSSELQINRFVYAPAEGQLAVVIKVVRGIFAYVSGRIAGLAPDAIRLETPQAIVGVRGTSLAFRVIPE